VIEEGGLTYIHLPQLTLPGCTIVEALLCMSARDGYPTRLLLSQKVEGKGGNWTVHSILDRPWHCWSWKDVSADQRPIEILAGHLMALR
jgi:hypothetical protein